MEFMKEKMVAFVVGMLKPEMIGSFVEAVKGWIDGLIDIIEDKIEASENQIDDQALPLIRNIREALNIPDNDEAAPAPETAPTPTPEATTDPYTDPDG